MKVKVICLPYIFQVLYVLCFSRPRYQVSVYRTIGPLVSSAGTVIGKAAIHHKRERLDGLSGLFLETIKLSHDLRLAKEKTTI